MKAKRCQFLMLRFRVTNGSTGLRDCGEPAQWRRTWEGGERFYCDDHKKLLDVADIRGQHWEEWHAAPMLTGRAAP